VSRRALRALPWLVAAAILTALVARLPRTQLLHAFAAGPSLPVATWSATVVAVALLADSWATLAAFAATGVRCPWRGVLVARGASYLLGLVNFAAGQGGMGFYLHRAGVAPLRAVGTMLFLMAAQVSALAALAAAGMAAGALAPAAGGSGGAAASAPGTTGGAGAAGGAMAQALAGPLPLLAALAAAFALYLALLAWRPAWLTRRAVLAPVAAAGAGGFLRATAARLPHALVMVLGMWLGLRLWGIPLPLARGLVVLSAAMLVMAVPVAPSGLGTLELTLVALASPYAPGASAAAQRAGVLAFTVVYHLASIIAQALLGLACLALITRRRASRPATLRGGAGTLAGGAGEPGGARGGGEAGGPGDPGPSGGAWQECTVAPLPPGPG
jgi:hypothetical protein